MGLWRNLGRKVAQAKHPVASLKNEYAKGYAETSASTPGGPRPKEWTKDDEDYYNKYVKKNAPDSPAERTATKAGSTVSRWGNRISSAASGASARLSSPAFKNFAQNAVSSGNDILGGGMFGGGRDLVGLGGAARKVSKKKRGGGKGKLRPAFYDAKTGKTYIAKTDKKVVAKTKKKHKKEKYGPREFDPW
jgi:hypothetical protein